MTLRLRVFLGALILLVGACQVSSPSPTTTTTTSATTTTSTPPGALVAKVQGAQIVNGSSQVIQLRGVNRPGTEYACTQSGAFTASTAGPTKDPAYATTEATSLLTWGAGAINTVRVPLNEDCWLGINGVNPAVSGANYQAFIARLVAQLTSQKMYVVLDLHWSAPGTWVPGANGINGQNVAPNTDHSVTFWSQVAAAYKGSPNVLFDLYNEPGLFCAAGSGCPASVQGYLAQDQWAWTLYRDGGSYTYNSSMGSMYASRVGQTFGVAGTQQLTNAIRATGATNPIIVETLGFGSGYIDEAGSYLPSDPLHQVIFSSHHYDFGGNQAGTATGAAALNTTLQNSGITGKVPYFVGEWGTTGSCPGTNTSWVTNELSWLDSHGYSYTAWGWDSGEGCGGPALVTNDETGATTAWGALVKADLQRLAH